MKKQWRDDLDTWASPIMANLLWVIFCVPVITLPLAFIGLFACMFYWMDDRHTQVFSIFFRTIRKAWWKAYLLLVLNVLIGGFLAFNLLIVSQMDWNNPLTYITFGATLFCTLIFLAATIPAWVLISIWDVPFKQIVSFSVKLVFVQPFWTVGLAVVFALILVVSFASSAALVITVTGALAAYVACWTTFHLLRKYFSREDLQLFDVI